MSRVNLLAFATLLALPTVALAQLPPLTEEESVKKVEAAEKKAASEEAAKVALGKAQDRVATRFYKKHPGAARPVPVVVAKPATPAAAK